MKIRTHPDSQYGSEDHLNVEPPLICFLAGQDFIPGSFVPGALNVPSGSFDAPANGPDPLNFDPNEDLANSLVEVSLQQTMTFPLVNFQANEIPEWVDTSDWADKPLKGTKEHPLRAIAGAHSQIRRANQGNDMRMALVNTEAGFSLCPLIGCRT